MFNALGGEPVNERFHKIKPIMQPSTTAFTRDVFYKVMIKRCGI
ncbi:hypothetical protein ALO59_102902 [Pseudomonas amygdali pv. mellea]|nr:hypothetical protein ALO51_102963 [Pseudomonas amygdali]KPX78711.1 hypothetical protein ALO59_102902 [Pseudomonas amygdali pv. mellea]